MERYRIEPQQDSGSEVSDFRKEEAYMRAKKRVEAIIGFYWHLISYVVVNVFLILVIGLNSSTGFSGFGPYATALFWGIGLLFHFIAVFGFNVVLGKHWEQKKMDEFMTNEQEKQQKYNRYD